jgi:hypothetical protein
MKRRPVRNGLCQEAGADSTGILGALQFIKYIKNQGVLKASLKIGFQIAIQKRTPACTGKGGI